ncbi:hypothetical protein P9112_008696 [Eukaryota sp. TZLM1-RC]
MDGPALSIVGGKVINLLPNVESHDTCFFSVILSSCSLPLTLSQQFVNQKPRFLFKFQLFGYIIRSQDFSSLDVPKLPTDKVTFALKCPKDVFYTHLPPLHVEFIASINSKQEHLLGTASFDLSSLSASSSSISSTCPLSFVDPSSWLTNDSNPSSTLTITIISSWRTQSPPPPSFSPSTSLPNPNVTPPVSMDDLEQWKQEQHEFFKRRLVEVEMLKVKELEAEWQAQVREWNKEIEMKRKKIEMKERKLADLTKAMELRKAEFDKLNSKTLQTNEKCEFYKQRFVEADHKRRQLEVEVTDLRIKLSKGPDDRLRGQIEEVEGEIQCIERQKRDLIEEIDLVKRHHNRVSSVMSKMTELSNQSVPQVCFSNEVSSLRSCLSALLKGISIKQVDQGV